jgi:16S rRNA G966 N2-methylase RsmD
MQSLAKGDMQDGDPVVVIESARAEKLSDSYGGLTLWDRKEFGDKFVSYYRVL